jgi:hypothetical protein
VNGFAIRLSLIRQDLAPASGPSPSTFEISTRRLRLLASRGGRCLVIRVGSVKRLLRAVDGRRPAWPIGDPETRTGRGTRFKHGSKLEDWQTPDSVAATWPHSLNVGSVNSRPATLPQRQLPVRPRPATLMGPAGAQAGSPFAARTLDLLA